MEFSVGSGLSRFSAARAIPILVLVLAFASVVQAEVLEFESQPSGVFASSIVEGDYVFTSTAGSIEPGGPFCVTFSCVGANGQFISVDGAPLTFARSDGQPFEFRSFTSWALIPGFGSMLVDGVTASGGNVSAFYTAIAPVFQTNTLPASFADVVSVTLTGLGPLAQDGFDDFDVVLNGPPPPDTSGTPGTMQLALDDRYVRYFGQNCDELDCDPPFDNRFEPSSSFSPFAQGSSGIGQTSTAETGRLAGTASVSGYSDIGYSIGDSTYDVTFDVATRTRIQLIGTVTSERTLSFGYGSSRVQLFRRDKEIFEASAEPDTAPIQAFAFDEVVSPGRYRVVVKADGDVGALGEFDFVLAADPAPPAVPMLFPVGAVVLVGVLVGSGRRALSGRDTQIN